MLFSLFVKIIILLELFCIKLFFYQNIVKAFPKLFASVGYLSSVIQFHDSSEKVELFGLQYLFWNASGEKYDYII